MAAGSSRVFSVAGGANVILLKRLLREPLFHFLMLALVIFALYDALDPTGARKPDDIVVTASKIDQLTSIFTKSWQRPPTAEELKGLIDDYVKEEIYVREAFALGLDKDDTIVRRRLRQKIEFMNDAGVEALVPTDADLEAYLKAHAAEFEVDPMIAFQQLFLSKQQHGARIEQDAIAILAALRATPPAEPATLGDATLLPYELPLTSMTSIGLTFGSGFTEALNRLAPGQWTGPITSDYGEHVVRVLERKAGRVPSLSEVRGDVVRDWTNVKRKKREDAQLNELLKRYRVTIESPPAASIAQ
jgi:parvulin-like peptidyl-prolyl isomerase